VTVLVHFSGPSYSKTAVLQPGAAPIDVGRDPEAAIHLPDNDRLISRRHLMLEWSDGGVKVTVLSKVNGVVTPRGEFGLGQALVLQPGESATLGRFSFVVEAGSAAAAMAPPPRAAAAPADDPFQAFGSSTPAAGNSVFDDPFFRAPAPPPRSSQMEMPAALDAMSGKQPVLGGPLSFSGASPAGSADPLAAFGGNQPPVHSSVSIDEFLGSPSRQSSGLGAASLLRPEAPDQQRRLASDHVHDFNLPLQKMSPSAPLMAPMPAPVQPPPASNPALDPLAALDAFAGPPAAAPSALPPAFATPVAAPLPRSAPAGNPGDPWGDFAKDWIPESAAPAPAPASSRKAPGFPSAPASSLNHAFDDAFSSSTAWRVDDMPLAEPPASSAFEADPALNAAFSMPPPAQPPSFEARASSGAPQNNEAALRALARGLGISGPQQLADKDWEQLGHSIRQIVQGLSDLMNVRAELKKEMRATDRTMLGAQENNPLKSGMGVDDLLQYLLFTPQGMAGYMPVKKALDESITDLRAHEFASLAAVRAVVEGSIKEFEPAKLRTTLMKGKRSIATAIDNARLWDLYTSHYQHKGEHMADWLEQVFNRHFMPAYSREADRLRREAQPPPPGRDPMRGF
jgi:predicted component of type VI protein secretion system